MSVDLRTRVGTERLLLVATAVFVVLVWELLGWLPLERFQGLDFIFPSTIEILAAGFDIVASGEIVEHAVITIQEVVIGFTLAATIGITFGAVLGANDYLGRAIEPLIYYISVVPKIVFYPIFLIVLGIGIESKIAMGFFSALFPITVNTVTGVMEVRPQMVEVAKAYEATWWQQLTKVYVPSTITYILNGLRLGVGVAIIGTLLGELFASYAGIGNLVSFYFTNDQLAEMYSLILIVFLVALTLNLLLLRLQRHLNEAGYGVGEEAHEGATGL